MDPIKLIQKYYDKNSRSYEILLTHSKQVARKALEVCDRNPALHADRKFIEEAAMLHDIGIFMTHAPSIACYGEHQYIEHGYLGAELLSREGFIRHALVCERHTGVGLSKKEIIEKGLPLPQRDMLPVSIEEQLICYADKFYSKSNLDIELTIEAICSSLTRHGEEKALKFMEWHLFFGEK